MVDEGTEVKETKEVAAEPTVYDLVEAVAHLFPCRS